MRKRFSERYRFVKPREVFQVESMDEGLKNRIWNKFYNSYIDSMLLEGYGSNSSNGHIVLEKDIIFFQKIYDEFLKFNIKPSKHMISFKSKFKIIFFQLNWYKIYDFIEYVSYIYHDKSINEQFRIDINDVLENEMSAYRFIDNYIAPIIDEVEIQEIEEALEIEYNGAKRHLSNALEFLSDRENPDYPNSIKESISAVEAVARSITGKDTDLSKCLKAMDLDLNKQFKTAMDNMYGWTCKEDGIRHGHTGEELKTSFEEAKYMLVTCSSFVNYMIAKKG